MMYSRTNDTHIYIHIYIYMSRVYFYIVDMIWCVYRYRTGGVSGCWRVARVCYVLLCAVCVVCGFEGGGSGSGAVWGDICMYHMYSSGGGTVGRGRARRAPAGGGTCAP